MIRKNHCLQHSNSKRCKLFKTLQQFFIEEVKIIKLLDSASTLKVNRSISDRVCETIRKAIVTKILSPGEALVESKIAKDLNVSITPVRKAFTTLANEGLLTVFPYKGTYVTIITKEYVSDVKFVRGYLEPAAIELCFDNLANNDADYLAELSQKSDSYFQQGNLYEAINYDILFHTFFFDKANSVLLCEIWNMLKYRIQIIQSYTKVSPVPKDYMMCRHGDIINAVRNLDKEALKQAMINHIHTSSIRANFPKSTKIQYK